MNEFMFHFRAMDQDGGFSKSSFCVSTNTETHDRWRCFVIDSEINPLFVFFVIYITMCITFSLMIAGLQLLLDRLAYLAARLAHTVIYHQPV